MENKIQTFLGVIIDCNIRNKEDYATFMAVIKEHCLDKGITDYDSIKTTWIQFKTSLKDLVEHVQVIGNNY